MTSKITQAQQQIEEELVERVVASFEDTDNPRLKELMQSLTKHLHNFVREVRLTEDEWNTAIRFLTDVGHITDDKRQEFILISDVLGVSMQTINVSNQTYKNATEATVFGPFFVDDAPEIPIGGDISGGASGEPSWIVGTVKDTDGNPIPNARIEVWEADDDGFYDVQYADGRIAGRSPIRAAHLHFMVTAPGYRTLVTHIFVLDDPQLDIGDAVFGVKESLMKVFEHHPAGTPTPDGRALDGPWSQARFDIVLAPAETA